MPNSEELQEAYMKKPMPTQKEKDYLESLVAKLKELDQEVTHASREKLFDELAGIIHPVNVDKGFWADPVMMDKVVAKIMLVVTECSEVVEALRKSQGADKVTEEFADVLIRLFDVYGVLVEMGEADPNLYAVMVNKMKVNKERPPKHGNRWG